MKYLNESHFLYGNKGSVWSNKVHIAETSNHTTLCGMPMLATNHASLLNIEEPGCKNCVRIFKNKQQ